MGPGLGIRRRYERLPSDLIGYSTSDAFNSAASLFITVMDGDHKRLFHHAGYRLM